MIQLVSKETYYKNNPDLLENPEYNLTCEWITGTSDKNPVLSQFSDLFDGYYYWKFGDCWFVIKVEYCTDVAFFIPKKYNLRVEDILDEANDIDKTNWWFTKISDQIPKEHTVNKFHQDTFYFSSEITEEPLTPGVYSLNSSDGDTIVFSYMIESHSWGSDTFICMKEKEVFPYDRDKVKLLTAYIEVIINWKRKQLSKQ